MASRDGLVKAGRYQLFCRQWGTDGAPVVLIHGIPTHSYLWHAVAPHLAANHRVIAVDLLGYGRSESGPVTDLSLPRQAEHILALLDTLGIQRAHFVGHDLGGGIVQILAVYHAERAASLFVTDGVCFSNWPVPQVVAMRRPAAPVFEPSPLRVQEMLRLGVYNQEVLTPELQAAFTAPIERPGGSGLLQLAAMALEHHQTEELVPHLSEIKVPATIAWGQYDRLLPAYWGYRLHESIPGSEFRLLTDAGHFTMLDRPAELAAEIQAHVTRVETTPIGRLVDRVSDAVTGLVDPH